MSGPRFFAPMVATLTAALLGLSAGPVFAAPAQGGGNHGGGAGSYHGGGAGSYHGGYTGGYHGGYTGGYHSGYYSGYHSGYYGGGYRSGYYGRYYGGYAPGYFGSLGVYPGLTRLLQPRLRRAGLRLPRAVGGPLLRRQPGRWRPGAATARPAPPPDGTAAVGVVVPADAEVWFNGDATQQKGEQREFVTPTLPVGRNYQYEIHARWKANGKVVDQTRTVIVHSNERTDVDFTRAEPIGSPIPAPPE